MAPNENGLWETSVPLLLPLGGPNEKPELGAGAGLTGEAPNVNGAFFSGGVAGAAPKEKGLADEALFSAAGAEPGRSPKENPLDAPGAPAPKRGLGASTVVEDACAG